MMSKVNSKRRTPLLFYIILTGSMALSLGDLLHPLPAPQKREVRELEKVSIKLAKSECSVLFNGICISEILLPNYSNINLHDDAAKREPITLKFRH